LGEIFQPMFLKIILGKVYKIVSSKVKNDFSLLRLVNITFSRITIILIHINHDYFLDIIDRYLIDSLFDLC